MKIISSFIKCFFAPLMVILLTAVAVSCSDDKDELQPGDGYVQFKLYKSASYDKTNTRAASKLEYLNDAKKMQVVLLHNNVTIIQTVALSAYNATDAEYGLHSDKLELVAGEYQLIGYYLFDKVEKEILAGEPVEPTKFVVTDGGLIVQDVLVNVIERGKVKFTLVKDIVATRSANLSAPFENIHRFKVAVENLETKQITEFAELKVSHKEGFEKDVLVGTAVADTTLYLRAGKYRFAYYYLFTKESKGPDFGFGDEFPEELTFTIKDNVETKVNLPVKVGLEDYLKDYLALREIWESLHGEDWSYLGEEYPRGANWTFDDKQMDMWGRQPGVSLDSKGRVVALNIGGFAPKGHLSKRIGDLTQLKALTIGTHNDMIGGGPIEQYGGKATPEQKKIMREDYYNKFLARDPRAGLSHDLQYACALNNAPIVKKQRGDISLLDVQYGELTNGVESLPEEIGNLVNLEQLYLANGKIKELPTTISNLKKCKEVEIYNCPEMREFPSALENMESLELLIIAVNKQWSSATIREGLKGLANSTKVNKTLQVLYMGSNNMDIIPEAFTKFVKLGKLDCTNNQITKIEKAFPSSINITQLSLDYNKLTSLPANSDKTFCGYANMESFTCSHNELTELPDIFGADNMYIMGGVNFSYNKISKISTDYRGINATSIDLSYNQLTEFPSVLFTSGSPMNTLILGGNQIEKIAKGSFNGKNAKMMKSMDLTFNKLSELPEDFNGATFPYLYGLDVSYNRLKAFPFEPLDATTLTVFSIRHQRDENGNRCMREWPRGVYNHIGLRALYLGSNDIRKVEDDQISPTIFNLDISDNPNIVIDLSSVCAWISAGAFNLYYDRTQDIRGCDVLNLK